LALICTLATPVVIYLWLGPGPSAFFCAVIFAGNPHLASFNIKNAEYTESVGQLLMISSLWALDERSLVAVPLLLLAGLCRETLVAALAVVALLWWPIVAPLPVATGLLAYFTRKQDRENTHPLVEDTIYGTIRKWLRDKAAGSIRYAGVFQPFRGALFAVPFMWAAVSPFARISLVALPVAWLFSLPASGQTRIVLYGIGPVLAFVAACPPEWAAVLAMLSWWWPVELYHHDERGTKSFQFAR
jgi:hypothetical protein